MSHYIYQNDRKLIIRSLKCIWYMIILEGRTQGRRKEGNSEGGSYIPPTYWLHEAMRASRRKPSLIFDVIVCLMLGDRLKMLIIEVQMFSQSCFLFGFHLCESVSALLTKENNIVVLIASLVVILIVPILEWIFLMKLSAFNDIASVSILI